MAHNIQRRDIQTGIEMAWHKLTSVVPEITNDNCGILYPMYVADTYFNSPDGEQIRSNGKQIVSADDNLPVGRVVGDDYKLISNSEIWEAIQSSIAGTGHKIISCGTVNDRSLGFVSIKVSKDFIAANRETQSVINVLWGHGGNRAVIARSGFTVIVCQNTFNMALSEKSEFRLSIRHTANSNVLDLTKAIDSHVGVAAEFKSAMDSMATISATASDARKIYAGFLLSGEEIPETKTGVSRFSNTIDSMVNLFANGRGNKGRDMADVFNGLTDYYSHFSSGKGGNWKQFVSSEFGSGNTYKSRFFDILTSPADLRDVKSNGEKALLALGL
jgi:hypothetical protein